MTRYKGSCHCGNIKFAVDMDIQEVMACNCSFCSRAGHLLAFTPEEHFTLLSDGGTLGDYQFGQKMIHHHFCTLCGMAPFGRGKMPDGTPIRAVNVRCLEGVDPASFKVTHFDGKSL